MSVVVDASTLVEVLLNTPLGHQARELLTPDRHAPELVVAEVVSVLRGLGRGGQISDRDAEHALEVFASFPLRSWPMQPLTRRCWELRDNLTAYDAMYVALAEALDAKLITSDRHLYLGATPVARCQIVLVA